MVQKIVRHLLVRPIGGNVQKGASGRKSFRVTHARVDVYPGVQHRFQHLPLPAERARVDRGPAVDVCGEDLWKRVVG